MNMTLDYEYCLKCDTRVLGVAGEAFGRTIKFNGLEVIGATNYIIKFGLPDQTSFQGTITDGVYTIPAGPVLKAGRVWVQIIASNSTSMIKKSQPLEMLVMGSIEYEPYEGETLPAYGEQVICPDGYATASTIGIAGGINTLMMMSMPDESTEDDTTDTDTDEEA